MLRLSLSADDAPIKIPLQNIGNNTYIIPKITYYSQLRDLCETWLDVNKDLTDEMYDHWVDLIINWNTATTNLAESLKTLIDEGNKSKIVRDLHDYSENKQLLDFTFSLPESILFTGDEKGFFKSFDSANHSPIKDFGRFSDWDVQCITVSPDQRHFFATEWGYVYQVSTKDMIDFAYRKKDRL